jgi:hypothetical protein
MKAFLTHAACFALGALALWGFNLAKAKVPTGPRVTVKNFDTLEDFGIRPGDLLLSVNGIGDPTMLDSLAEGIKKGEVCVVFERHSVKREVCLKRS